MTLFARSDVLHIAIPAEDGGCGSPHTRPVVKGAPAKLWDLTCPACEGYLKRRADPQWTHSRLELPLTPDEERIARKMEEQGDQVMHQVSAALAQSSMQQLRDTQQQELDAHRVVAEKAELEDQYRTALMSIDMLTARLAELESKLAGPVNETSPVSDASLSGPEIPRDEPRERPVGERKGSVSKAVQGVSGPSCPQCGGPMRQPGQKGPTPKGICMKCRKARAAAA